MLAFASERNHKYIVYCLDSSPTDITHLILFYSGSIVGKMKSNLYSGADDPAKGL